MIALASPASCCSAFVGRGAAGRRADHPARLFRNRIFTVTSAVGFIVGIALFGAVAYLPLFLQVVKGAQPDQLGPAALPLMARHARHLGRLRPAHQPHGRYKVFPVAGTALMPRRPVLLSGWASTPTWSTAAYMLVLGLGLGLVIQVLVLAVQNSVDLRDLGRGDSGSTLFRSIGGSSASRSSARSSPTGSRHTRRSAPTRAHVPAARRTLRWPGRSRTPSATLSPPPSRTR